MSKIEWTDKTWNFLRGCSRTGPDCDNCYAIREARRKDVPGGSYEGLTRKTADGRLDWSGRVHVAYDKLPEPLRWRKPQKVFVDSMSDMFHPSVPDEVIDMGFATMLASEVISNCAKHVYQILTKRAGRAREYLSADPKELVQRWAKAGNRYFAAGVKDLSFYDIVLNRCSAKQRPDGTTESPYEFWSHPENVFPLPRVHLGVSVGQEAARDLVEDLLQTPAALRFVSIEPLWGDLNPRILQSGIDWAIVGGETGPGARPMPLQTMRNIIAYGREHGIATFIKQTGRWIEGDETGFVVDRWLLRDGRVFVPPIIGPYKNVRPESAVAFSIGRKGNEPFTWPEDLRVREFPEAIPISMRGKKK